VGKGGDAEPPIDLDTMLDLTAAAEVDGQKFDGVDLFLSDPHISIDSSADEIKALADKIGGMGFAVGSLVAPVWDGSTLGDPAAVNTWLTAVKKACGIARALNETGVRTYGVIRIDSSVSPEIWAQDPVGNQKKVAEVFRQGCDIAADHGERLAAEGEICWGGMHDWKDMVDLLEMVDRDNIGFQADMAHTLLYLLGYNAPEYRIVPEDFDWSDREAFEAGMRKMTAALRPWTIDFHVAQNDATVHGTGSHDKTGRHCLVTDPNGKLDVPRDAGFWLRDEGGNLTKAFRHICWDGCMFPNEVMMQPQTWNDILATMIQVQGLHGWNE